MNKLISGALVLLILLCSTALFASEGDHGLPAGDEIAKRINARDTCVSFSKTLIMELIDRRGKKRLRETQAFCKYYGEEKRTVIFYKEPKNIKDTAFLTIDYAESGAADDQWLYLPALRKVRRISASHRGDYFLGTDFTYEDIKKETKVDINDYNQKTICEEVVDGHRCYVVEGVPVSDKIVKELGYSKARQWVDADIWITRKAVMWDVNGALLKTIQFSDIRKVQDIWTIHQMVAKNHKTEHITRFVFKDVDYKSEVKDDLFTEQALRRGL